MLGRDALRWTGNNKGPKGSWQMILGESVSAKERVFRLPMSSKHGRSNASIFTVHGCSIVATSSTRFEGAVSHNGEGCPLISRKTYERDISQSKTSTNHDEGDWEQNPIPYLWVKKKRHPSFFLLANGDIFLR